MYTYIYYIVYIYTHTHMNTHMNTYEYTCVYVYIYTPMPAISSYSLPVTSWYASCTCGVCISLPPSEVVADI